MFPCRWLIIRFPPNPFHRFGWRLAYFKCITWMSDGVSCCPAAPLNTNKASAANARNFRGVYQISQNSLGLEICVLVSGIWGIRLKYIFSAYYVSVIVFGCVCLKKRYTHHIDISNSEKRFHEQAFSGGGHMICLMIVVGELDSNCDEADLPGVLSCHWPFPATSWQRHQNLT